MPAQPGLLADRAAQVLPAQRDRHDRPPLDGLNRRRVEIGGRVGRSSATSLPTASARSWMTLASACGGFSVVVMMVSFRESGRTGQGDSGYGTALAGL